MIIINFFSIEIALFHVVFNRICIVSKLLSSFPRSLNISSCNLSVRQCCSQTIIHIQTDDEVVVSGNQAIRQFSIRQFSFHFILMHRHQKFRRTIHYTLYTRMGSPSLRHSDTKANRQLFHLRVVKLQSHRLHEITRQPSIRHIINDFVGETLPLIRSPLLKHLNVGLAKTTLCISYRFPPTGSKTVSQTMMQSDNDAVRH